MAHQWLEFKDAKLLSMSYEAQMLGEIFQYAVIKRITISGYMDSSERASWGNVNTDSSGVKENWEKAQSMSHDSRESFWDKHVVINGFRFGKGRVLSIDFSTRPNMVRVGEYVAELEIYEQLGSDADPDGFQGPDLSNMKDDSTWENPDGDEVKVYKNLSNLLSKYGPVLEDLSEDFSFDHDAEGKFGFNHSVTVKFRKEFFDSGGKFSRTTGDLDIHPVGGDVTHPDLDNYVSNEDMAYLAGDISNELFFNQYPDELLLGNIAGEGESGAETIDITTNDKRVVISEDYDFMNCSFSFTRKFDTSEAWLIIAGVGADPLKYSLHTSRSLSQTEDGNIEVSENGEVMVFTLGGYGSFEEAARAVVHWQRDGENFPNQSPGQAIPWAPDSAIANISWSFYRCAQLYENAALGLSDMLNPDGAAGDWGSRFYWKDGYPRVSTSAALWGDGAGYAVYSGPVNGSQAYLLSGIPLNKSMSSTKGGNTATYNVSFSTNDKSNFIFPQTGERLTTSYVHEYNVSSSKDLSGNITNASISGTLRPNGSPGGGFSTGVSATSSYDAKRKLTAGELSSRKEDCVIVGLWAQAEAERYMFRIEDHNFGRAAGILIGTMAGLNDTAGEPMAVGAKYFTTKRNWSLSPYGGEITYSYELVNDQASNLVLENASDGSGLTYKADSGLTRVEVSASDTVPVGMNSSYLIPWYGEKIQLGLQTEVGTRSITVTGQLSRFKYLYEDLDSILKAGHESRTALGVMYDLAKREAYRIPWHYSAKLYIRDIWFNSLTFNLTSKSEATLTLDVSWTCERANDLVDSS